DALRDDGAKAGIEVLATGIPLFAADGADRARRDVTAIGFGSLSIIALLMVAIFRTPVPMLLSLATVLSGLAVGFAVSLVVFERVHLLTLVFGSTLIGVTIDYSLHYLCDAFRGETWTPGEGVKRIFTATWLGLITTVLAYASMAIAPFPALRQISVF